MKTKAIVILMFVIILAGCARNHPAPSLTNNPQDSIISEFGSINVLKSAKVNVLPLESKKYSIQPHDPIVNFGEYMSNYKVFSMDLAEGDTFNVDITSICSCIGLNKRILVPRAYVVNADGNVIETMASKYRSELSFVGYSLSGTVKTEGMYFLVVAANNSNPGKPVAMDTVQVNGYIPTGIRISNNSSPYGQMFIHGRITK
ncbi:hypothetical protein [Simiduia aestuariiviva]|uniref:DUF1573 domain-containing protein n=1 Tax=Simiduia aestuariiviva TaxID=1510459 RepID=A0A839URV5_9GAMM|nr:hypothetical protein [Simiduia aestuariiviva]MBB3169441.1 hypothetical protein [Simiduia aestuariiviva]